MPSSGRNDVSSSSGRECHARWQALVCGLVDAQSPGSAFARHQAAGAILGVSYKTVEGYVGGLTREADRVRLPRVDELGALCARGGWNPLYVLAGRPHPKLAGELRHETDVAEAVAAYVTTRLPPCPGRGAATAAVRNGWTYDAAGGLAALVEQAAAERARLVDGVTVQTYLAIGMRQASGTGPRTTRAPTELLRDARFSLVSPVWRKL